MKKREVNIELLRIIAILMVLGLHANFMALGAPYGLEICGEGILRIFLQSLSIVAVNLFVMISGWFGIKPSMKGFFNLFWQIIYCISFIIIIEYLFYDEPITLKSSLQIFSLFGGGGWFVGAYLGLYILSPLINSYLITASQKKILCTLLLFFGFEFIWGNTLSVGYIQGGYSAFSFIGIYMLAGYLKKVSLSYNRNIYLWIFLLCMILNTLIYATASSLNLIIIRDITLNYINPIVIIGSGALLLYFNGLKAKLHPKYEKFILWVASSCFAAYLLHTGTDFIREKYCLGVQHIYSSNSGVVTFFIIVCYILLIFLAAILIDQPRAFVWKKFIYPQFFKRGN